MKNPIPFLLTILVVGLMIAGFVYLNSATSVYVSDSIRTPSLVAGITCISLSTGLVVLGVVMYRKKD